MLVRWALLDLTMHQELRLNFTASVDHFQNTAGDIALSLNNSACYTLIRDAGIRAELLLALLSDHESSLESNAMLVRSEDTTAAGSQPAFLSSHLTYSVDDHGQEICSVFAGGEEIGVMMGWEKEISESWELLCLSSIVS